MVMRSIFLLLCCAAPGGAFAPNLPPSVTRSSLCRGGKFGAWRASHWLGSHASVSRVQADEEGGDGTRATSAEQSAAAGMKAKKEALEAKMEPVEASIKTVETKIESVEAALSGEPPYLGITDSGVLLKEKEQLRKKEDQLRKEEELLFIRRDNIEDSVSTSDSEGGSN